MEVFIDIATAVLAAGGVGGGTVWYYKKDTRPNGGESAWDRVWKEFDQRENNASAERRLIHERVNDLSDRVSHIEGMLERRRK